MKLTMLPLHRMYNSFVGNDRLNSQSRYRKLLSRFDTNIRDPDVNTEPPQLPHRIPIIGFSATFSRHDGLALGSVFERIGYHRDFLDMIKEQWYFPTPTACSTGSLTRPIYFSQSVNQSQRRHH